MRTSSKPTFMVESRRLKALFKIKKIDRGSVVVEVPGDQDLQMCEGDVLNLSWDEPFEEPLNADDRE